MDDEVISYTHHSVSTTHLSKLGEKILGVVLRISPSGPGPFTWQRVSSTDGRLSKLEQSYQPSVTISQEDL